MVIEVDAATDAQNCSWRFNVQQRRSWKEQVTDAPQMSDGECFQILKRNFRALSWLRERYYNNGLYGKNGTTTSTSTLIE